VQETDVITGTQGGGGWAKREAEVMHGADEDADGDVIVVHGVGWGTRAACGAVVDVGVVRGMVVDIGTARGMATVSKVPTNEEG
jgi:hypothetical protein